VTHPWPRTSFGFLFYGAAGIALGLVGYPGLVGVSPDIEVH